MEEVQVRELGPVHLKRLNVYWQRPASMINNRDMVDLDLQSRGLVQCLASSDRSARAEITPAGIELMIRLREKRIANTRPHHDLGQRLGQWLAQEQGRLVWTNTEFKAFLQPVDGQESFKFVKPDVFSILPTHNVDKISPVIHEVKISRADFFADVARPEKRGAYLALASAVYYVLPAGMVAVTEVPIECGLLFEEAPGQFTKIRSIRAKRSKPHPWNMLNMVLKPPHMSPVSS